MGLLTTCIIGWIFYCGTSCTTLHAQTISASGLQDGNIACPDSVVVFTCITRNSSAIAWWSASYVVEQIGFSYGQQVGATQSRRSNPNTLATLTRNYMDKIVRVLESTLHVVASLDSPQSSVRCIHIDSGRSKSVSFRVLADPLIPHGMISKQIKDEMGRCMLLLMWSSPVNIAIRHVMTYIIQIDEHNSVNKTNSDNSCCNLFIHSVCTCGPHTVSISAVNICHRVGRSTPDVTLHTERLSTPLTCPVPKVTTADVTTTYAYVTTGLSEPTVLDSVPQECSHVAEIIMAIIIIAILLVTTIVFAVLWCIGAPAPKWAKKLLARMKSMCNKQPKCESD